MKREAVAKVRSVIDELDSYGLAVGDSERTENEYPATYETKNGVSRIEYFSETEGGRVDTTVIARADHVIVEHRGAVSCRFDFREGVTHRSLYTVAPYSFDTEITPKKIRFSLTDEGGELELFYLMNIGGADKSVRMKIWIS